MPKIVACPNCGKPVEWTEQSRWRPFCSERCRLLDLGEWFDEGHRIGDPTDAPGDDPPNPDDTDTH